MPIPVLLEAQAEAAALSEFLSHIFIARIEKAHVRDFMAFYITPHFGKTIV